MLCLQWTRAVHALCSDQLVNTPHEIAEMVCSCPPPQMFGRPPPLSFLPRPFPEGNERGQHDVIKRTRGWDRNA